MIDNLGVALTDNDVVKALECCAKRSLKSYHCPHCPLYDEKCLGGDVLKPLVIGLIKRQQAEIDRLYEEANHYQTLWCKAEEDAHNAIKEFAAKLKESAFECDVSFGYGREHYTEAVAVVEIDNLVNEMTEENKDDNA